MDIKIKTIFTFVLVFLHSNVWFHNSS